MSLHETWRTHLFWKKVGGMLIKEFVAVNKTDNSSRRLIDAVIVLDEKRSICKNSNYNISGKNIILVQTKVGRLGMNLLGQAFFSKKLLIKHKPKSIRTVAICSKTDQVMEALARKHKIDVVVIREKN